MTALSSYFSSEPSLHPHYTEDLKASLDGMTSKSRMYSIASKVCVAAFLSIAALAITASLGVTLPFPTSVLITAIIATVPLNILSSVCYSRSMEYQYLAQTASGLWNAQQKIQHWGTKEIKNFLEQHKILEETLPKEELAKLNPEEPLKGLLPVIARYQYWHEQTEASFFRYQANLSNESLSEPLKTVGRSQGWSILETKVLPSALKTALMLKIIAEPKEKISWESLGTCVDKSFEQRMFDRLIEHSDEYFHFQDVSRPSLTLQELMLNLDPLNIEAIRDQLFRSNKETCSNSR